MKSIFITSLYRPSLSVLLTGSFLLSCATAYAESEAPQTHSELINIYETLESKLAANEFGAPIHVTSQTNGDKAIGHVFAILNHSYKHVRHVFSAPQNWCNAATLHVNVKSCISNTDTANDKSQLSIYIGDKEYQDPDDAYRIDYRYENTVDEQKFFHTRMSAKSGPLDSKDFFINIKAMPIDDESTFIYFSYSARYGWISKFLLKAYLVTAGRNKVGFTQDGLDEQGNTIYIKGIKGVIERNAMRYFLALQSYLDTYSLPNNKRFEASLIRWFEFTKKYRKQLYELDFDEYRVIKVKERVNQMELQLAIQQLSN